MTIKLHPVIGNLVKESVDKANAAPTTAHARAIGWKPATADEMVNELLWLALRRGDVKKHYTKLK